MSLEEYNNKRDFKSTSEPKGELDLSNKSRFVIQRHQASRLHYDLRLEIEGALKSWAVPKGPSMNPKDKRLAVQTEDHPIKYLNFRGIIPKGNYGAGYMDIWDAGTFSIYEGETAGSLHEQYRNGNLKIELRGIKVKGRFALVRTKIEGKQQQWLLIKKKDEFSTDLHYDAEIFAENKDSSNAIKNSFKLRLGSFIKPMLAESIDTIFSDPDYIYEFKWDGYRMIAQILEGRVQMVSRNGISFNNKFKLLYDQLQSLPHDVVLDGEVVITNEDGLPQFQKLQNYNSRLTQGRLTYYVFDLLHLNGHDTISLPLKDRKSLIPEILEGMDHIVYCDHIEGMGVAFYKRAIELGMEGVIAKKINSVYSPGFRTKDWLKIKEFKSIEAFICGYTTGKGRGKLFGSLILGVKGTTGFEYIGNCGTGFDSREQSRLQNLFKPLKAKRSPFTKKIKLMGREPHWLLPKLQCTVSYSEWTKGSKLRHPVYKGLIGQLDMDSNNVERSNEVNANYKETGDQLELDGRKVPLTNLDKVYWPASGLRKYDLIDYYIKVSDTIIPYLKGRPQNLHRHPNGITFEGFYQKDIESLPAWIASVMLHSKSAERDINYLVCENQATLVYMANMGCIEINPWNSKVSNLNSPDYTVIDLDPSEANSFNEILEVARVTKEILDYGEIAAYCKTTGKRGLHIYIPLNSKYSYEEARNFTRLLCMKVHERLPKLTSLERSVKKRKGKVYLDFMQNRRAQTLASAYCVRPIEGAPVSTPVSWNEVEMGFDKDQFTIMTVPSRIEKLGDLFVGVLGDGIEMIKILERLDDIE